MQEPRRELDVVDLADQTSSTPLPSPMARVSPDTSCRIVDDFAAEEQVRAGAAVLALRADVVHQRSRALREATGGADVQVIMSMMSQDGPSKRRRTPGWKWPL